MKNLFYFLIVILLATACTREEELEDINTDETVFTRAGEGINVFKGNTINSITVEWQAKYAVSKITVTEKGNNFKWKSSASSLTTRVNVTLPGNGEYKIDVNYKETGCSGSMCPELTQTIYYRITGMDSSTGPVIVDPWSPKCEHHNQYLYIRPLITNAYYGCFELPGFTKGNYTMITYGGKNTTNSTEYTATQYLILKESPVPHKIQVPLLAPYEISNQKVRIYPTECVSSSCTDYLHFSVDLKKSHETVYIL